MDNQDLPNSSSGEHDIDPQMLSEFLDESASNIELMNQGLLAIESGLPSADLMDQIFRAAHSIKGAAGFLDLNAITNLTHKLENVFDSVRRGERQFDDTFLNLSFESCDVLGNCLDAVANQESPLPDTGPLIAKLIALLEQPDQSPESGQTVAQTELAATLETTDHEHIGELPVWLLSAMTEGDICDCLVTLAGGLPFLGILVDARVGIHLLAILEELQSHQLTVRSLDAEQVNDSPQFLPILALANKPDQDLANIADLIAGRAASVWLTSTEGGQSLHHHLSAEDQAQLSASTEISDDRSIQSTETQQQSVQTQQADRSTETISNESQRSSIRSATTLKEQTRSSQTNSINTIRVDIERLDHLLNTAGELAITKAQLSSQIDQLHSMVHFHARNIADESNEDIQQRWQGVERLAQSLREASVEMHRHTSTIQNDIMRTRMVPIGPLFTRFHRLIRDVSRQVGKRAALIIEGEATELDKRLIDQLGDPLTHLIRNSLDHGLENPEQRGEAGKQGEGTVYLRAFHSGSHICVQVGDDGRGLSHEKIGAKAVERGLLTQDQVAEMTREEILQCIFMPGFSTAAAVTDISGRGVGMDIVLQCIRSMKGTVSIDSTEGAGTTFTISLPLTLAMIEALLVEIGDGCFAFPVDTVEEIIELRQADIHQVGKNSQVIALRDQTISVIDPAEVLEHASGMANQDVCKAVVVEHRGTSVAVVVRQVIGDEEIVIKNLSSEFALVSGISGATLLGDGRIALILSVADLIDQCTGGHLEQALPAQLNRASAA